MNEPYISKQIAVYKNNKTLVEFNDKLKVASVENYAHIHATGEPSDDGYKRTSLIGILMKDYSKGTGDNAVTVTANISPDEVRFILSRLSAGYQTYEFSQDKIFGKPDEKGYTTVTKFRILRVPKDTKGEVKKYPWYLEIENGIGIPVKNATGGTYMKANSFKSSGKVFTNLNDLDMYKLLVRTSAYIDAWEKVVATSLITTAKKRIELNRAAQRNNTAA